MNIRRIKVEDIDKVKLLEKELLKFEFEHDNRLDIDYDNSCTKYIDDEDSLILVSDENGKVNGFLYGYIMGRRGAIRGKCAVLNNLYVQKEYRKQGLGKQFLELFKTWCIQKDVDYIEVNAYSNNDNAKKFYKDNEFDTKIECMNYSIKR